MLAHTNRAEELTRCIAFVAIQVQISSSFKDDLGLDSLDTVEVLMAVEEVLHHPYNYWSRV